MKLEVYQFEVLYKRLKATGEELHRINSTFKNFDVNLDLLSKVDRTFSEILSECSKVGNKLKEQEGTSKSVTKGKGEHSVTY